jgi:hypothetical protein
MTQEKKTVRIILARIHAAPATTTSVWGVDADWNDARILITPVETRVGNSSLVQTLGANWQANGRWLHNTAWSRAK